MERTMTRNRFIALGFALLSAGSASFGQPIAGSSQLGVSVAELRSVATGWSAKRQILGQPVYNDQGERIGTVDDIIVAPDKALSYAIIGVGGFLGLNKHDVAVSVNQFKQESGRLLLPGASKEALQALPEFEYAKG
jgi:hypothetical protein